MGQCICADKPVVNDVASQLGFSFPNDVLSVLLQDKTMRRNIKWATDSYERYGARYYSEAPICLDQIKDPRTCVIKPRHKKRFSEQRHRSKREAEVFTPLWICNAQNNLVDNAWFGSSGMFNVEEKGSWQTTSDPVVFPEDKSWMEYVKSVRMEVSCGEAPYLASRVDVITGEFIPVERRIGLLDRKLRIVSENTSSADEWLIWADHALKSVYGYDWQGDNVLLARNNLLLTVSDYYYQKFGEVISHDRILRFAKIVAWNIWQMDGIKCVVPNSCKNYSRTIDTMFGPLIEKEVCSGCVKKTIENHNGIYCKIMDWDKRKAVLFKDLMEK